MKEEYKGLERNFNFREHLYDRNLFLIEHIKIMLLFF